MMKYTYRILVQFVLALGLSLLPLQALHSQTLNEARALILKQDYEGARLAFSHLITQSAYKNRGDVNKWYGQSLYETGHYDQAVPYLNVAAKKRIWGSYIYLAQEGLRTYNLKQAKEYAEKYKKAAKPTDSLYVVAGQLIEQADRVDRALNRVERVVIIDSLRVGKAGFFKHYRLGQDAGQILDLQLENDRSSEAYFLSQRQDKRLFGLDSAGNMNIVEQSKLLGDQWSDPVALPAQVNTPADESFPFLLTDGVTLYYSSNKAGGLGGYDLYVTRHDVSSDSYFRSEHLPMPFNSVANDYMLAIDEVNQVGWFATDRFQPRDSVMIYLFIAHTNQKSYYERVLEGEAIVDLAKINSLRQTWPKDVNYQNLLDRVYAQQGEKEAQDNDFFFVINDHILYTHWSDFVNEQARMQYARAHEAQVQQQQARQELEKLREQWAKTAEASRNPLRTPILQLETQVHTLEVQSHEAEKNARRLEQQALIKQQ